VGPGTGESVNPIGPGSQHVKDASPSVSSIHVRCTVHSITRSIGPRNRSQAILHPSLTPLLIENQSDITPFTLTQLQVSIKRFHEVHDFAVQAETAQ